MRYQEMYEMAKEKVNDLYNTKRELEQELSDNTEANCDISYNEVDAEERKDILRQKEFDLRDKINRLEWQIRDAEYKSDELSRKAWNEDNNSNGLTGALIGAGVGLLIDTAIASSRANSQDTVYNNAYTAEDNVETENKPVDINMASFWMAIGLLMGIAGFIYSIWH